MRQVEQNKDNTPPLKADDKAAPAAVPATPLPNAEHIQRLFGSHDVSGVGAHASASDQAFGAATGAAAYAQGNDIHMAGESEGNELEGHELSHVVQQRNGRP